MKKVEPMSRMSKDLLLKWLKEGRFRNRQIVATLCSKKKSGKVTTDEWCEIFRWTEPESKLEIWRVLSQRKDLTLDQLKAIKVDCKGSYSLKKIAEEAHTKTIELALERRQGASQQAA